MILSFLSLVSLVSRLVSCPVQVNAQITIKINDFRIPSNHNPGNPYSPIFCDGESFKKALDLKLTLTLILMS